MAQNIFEKLWKIKTRLFFPVMATPFLPEIHASEVTTGNPNTEDEKKSKVEIKKQEIKANQELNMNCNSNIEPNLVGNGIVGEIGEIGKNEAIISNQELESTATNQLWNSLGILQESQNHRFI